MFFNLCQRFSFCFGQKHENKSGTQETICGVNPKNSVKTDSEFHVGEKLQHQKGIQQIEARKRARKFENLIKSNFDQNSMSKPGQNGVEMRFKTQSNPSLK